MDDDIIRILVSTDNHLGFMEKDPIRCNDAMSTFEEALYTAKMKNSDMLLLAGDLFHENKPSRRTLHGSIDLLKKYCFGDNPVYIEMLNEQSEVFKNRKGMVNYDDPFQAISLPVFAIHGNHDDPSREGGSESLSAMDLLSVSNCVNYFGKAEQIDNIDITPILLRKGNTLLAIYGLGAIRDERLNRMWNQNKIRFVRPVQNRDEFFNIFVLHQNRDYGRGAKNCVHESMIPEWIDLVIWGNEHECKTSLAESLVGTFRIYQPGSSVATSLVEGESLTNPKHMGFIEIKTRKFRHSVLPYTQVRSFVYSEINLTEPQYGLDVNHPKLEEKIKHYLAVKMKSMIAAGKKHAQEVTPYFMQDTTAEVEREGDGEEGSKRVYSDVEIAAAAQHCGITYVTKQREIVLARLRIEQAPGFPTVHPQRFGAQFVGEVANPGELLLFAKQKKERVVGVGQASGADRFSSSDVIGGDGDGSASVVRVEDLVRQSLQRSRNLSLLPESELSQALEDFVTKRHISAITDVVAETLERVQAELTKDRSSEMNTRQLITDAAKSLKEKAEDQIRKGELTRVRVSKRQPVVEEQGSDGEVADEGMEVDCSDSELPRTTVKATVKGRTAAAGRGTKTGRNAGTAAGRGAKAGRGATTAAAAKAKAKSNTAADISTLFEPKAKTKAAEPSLSEDEEQEEEQEEEVMPMPTKSVRARAAASATSRGRGRGRGAVTEDISDESESEPEAEAESDCSEESYEQPRGKKVVAGRAKATTPRVNAAPKAKAPTKSKKTAIPVQEPVVLDDDSDSDSDPEANFARTKRPVSTSLASPEPSPVGSTQKKSRKLPGSITGGASKAAVVSKWK